MALAELPQPPEEDTAPKKDDPWAENDHQFVLSRATTRFALDLRRLSAVEDPPRSRGKPPASAQTKRVLTEEEKDVRSALASCSKMATRARNTAMRALYRTDSALLDDFITSNGGNLPRGKEDVEYPKAYSYPLLRKAAPLLASGMAATLAREVDRKWVSERRAILIHEEKSPPHYRVGQPFPVRHQDCRWMWDVEHGRAAVTVQLFTGARINRYLLPIEARDKHQADLLRNLASGEWKAGELRIERDRLRPSKWYLRVGYKRRVAKRVGGLAAAINRGMRFFLVAMIQPTTAFGHGETWVYDGADIESTLKQFQKRRQSHQRQILASGRVGHGRPRALRPIEHLTGIGERWRQTRCQTIARRLARWLSERNVSRVYLDDFTGIRDAPPELLAVGSDFQKQFVWERIQEWPYFQLGTRLAACLQEYGIDVMPLEPDGNSITCPQCGHVDAKSRDLTRWKLRCGVCKYSRHLDVAFCQNALAKSRGEEPGSASGAVAGESAASKNEHLQEVRSTGKTTARKPSRKPAKPVGSGGTGRDDKKDRKD